MTRTHLVWVGLVVLSLGQVPARGAADQLNTGEDGKPSIVIDATQKGQPISKYIYGQFIEHLGRCIYGGIWAEMLEDRKFIFPVTADYQPYRALQDTPHPVVGFR